MDNFPIAGYSSLCLKREKSQGRGVGFYIRSELEFMKVDILSIFIENSYKLVGIKVRVKLPCDKWLIVVSVYSRIVLL